MIDDYTDLWIILLTFRYYEQFSKLLSQQFLIFSHWPVPRNKKCIHKDYFQVFEAICGYAGDGCCVACDPQKIKLDCYPI